MWKHVSKNLQCRRGLTPPQHIPWRETFPIKWQWPGRLPRCVKVKKPHSTQKGEGMGSKDTSVSHQQLPKHAITCKLAGIEMDARTAKARSSLSEVAGQWKKRRRMPHHPFVDQDPGPLQKRANQSQQHWFKNLPLTMNPSWSGRAEKKQ